MKKNAYREAIVKRDLARAKAQLIAMTGAREEEISVTLSPNAPPALKAIVKKLQPKKAKK